MWEVFYGYSRSVFITRDSDRRMGKDGGGSLSSVIIERPLTDHFLLHFSHQDFYHRCAHLYPGISCPLQKSFPHVPVYLYPSSLTSTTLVSFAEVEEREDGSKEIDR